VNEFGHLRGSPHGYRLVEREVVVQPTADQVGQWSADDLAEDVPACDLEGALGVTVSHQRHVHHAADATDVGGIVTQQCLAECLQRGTDAPDVGGEVSAAEWGDLTPAIDGVGGGDPDQRAGLMGRLAPLRHDVVAVLVPKAVAVDLYPRDLHCATNAFDLILLSART
jgi:hypothetical protein